MTLKLVLDVKKSEKYMILKTQILIKINVKTKKI